MSKTNPLGLIASYGDSDEESDEGSPVKRVSFPPHDAKPVSVQPGIHPSPIPHCPWSACYDENSGFTYYWNQHTNAVTWEAPTEYLLALKLAQQQLTTTGAAEVSAEEWQLYQQALAEKQKQKAKPVTKSILKKPQKKVKKNIKRKSVEEEEKIELITSYHNSDSESNDETEKELPTPKPNKITKIFQKKFKPIGPLLPPKQNYSAPIGPELPPGLETKPKVPEKKVKESPQKQPDDVREEKILLKKLKDKAKLLEKLGGELPSDIRKIIREEPASRAGSPTSEREVADADVPLEVMEKKDLSKTETESEDGKTKSGSDSQSCRANGLNLFPSAAFFDKKPEKDTASSDGQKKENHYLLNIEPIENVNRKRLRISKTVLPDRNRERVEPPAYTTKYAQCIEGFSGERTGLGFSKDEECAESPKNTISYGNGLNFTKGETLNEEKKDEDLDDLTDLVEAKLKFLGQLEPYSLTPLQEMAIQMQTLVAAYRAGALSEQFWRRWAGGARSSLSAHEAAAAPPGWHCVFLRSEGRYCYTRESDGFVQFEYPAVDTTDMDISTTPPHDTKEEDSWRETTPPPGIEEAEQTTADPIPKVEIGDELQLFYNDIAEIEKGSGTEPNSPEPLPPPPPPPQELSDAIKEMERDVDSGRERDEDRDGEQREKSREKETEDREKSVERDVRVPKKRVKVKLSTSMGMKHKSVSDLVAKWQQVAEEIGSD